ncbi:hypothetical protein N752_18965 [Desulforamulus aquiferis]|nr:cache domain-containing protein [Desulforamulus aquiferis]RYD03491.1 hypothetical protein N752_18965 [Desulforamulus aquiferis]
MFKKGIRIRDFSFEKKNPFRSISFNGNFSIRLKFLAVLFLAVVALIITNLYALTNYKTGQSEQLHHSLEQTVIANSNLLEENLKKHIHILDILSKVNEVQGEDLDEALDYLKSELKHQMEVKDVMFESFGLIELDGSAINTDDAPVDLRDRDYFIAVTSGDRFAYSAPLISKVNNKMSVVLAVPVKNDGVIIRVLYSRLNLDRLSEQVLQMKYGEKGRAYLVDASGITIVHPNEELLLKNLTKVEGPVTEEVAKSTTQMVETKNGQIEYAFEGEQSIASFRTITTAGWILAIVANRDEVFVNVDTTSQKLLLITIIVSVILLGIGWYLGTKIIEPINRLLAATGRVSKGQLNEEIRVTSRDEIGKLAQSFEEMRINLKELIGGISTASNYVNETVFSLSSRPSKPLLQLQPTPPQLARCQAR